MKLILEEERFEFDFPNAKALYKFDERNPETPHFHGASHCMKAVDVLAEFGNFQLWIEIKDYPDEHLEELKHGAKQCDGKSRKALLLDNLKQKFRDTYLYRYCENKANLPVYYLMMVNFDKSLLPHFLDEVRRILLADNVVDSRWASPLIERQHVGVVYKHQWPAAFEQKFGTCRKLP